MTYIAVITYKSLYKLSVFTSFPSYVSDLGTCLVLEYIICKTIHVRQLGLILTEIKHKVARKWHTSIAILDKIDQQHVNAQPTTTDLLIVTSSKY